jgi:hypothetical protein
MRTWMIILQLFNDCWKGLVVVSECVVLEEQLSSDHLIQLEPSERRMNKRTSTEIARSFLTDSEAFLIAAQVLDRSGEVAASGPKYYLACHSIELILKAFILTNGGAESELFEIRHDLSKACARTD